MISKRNENKARNKKIKAGKGILKSRVLFTFNLDIKKNHRVSNVQEEIH